MTKNRLVLVASLVVAIAVAGVAIASGRSLLFPTDAQQGAQLQELAANGLGQKAVGFPSQIGRPDLAVYVARLSDGSICVSDAQLNGIASGGACGPADSPLGGKPFMAVFASAGGATGASLKEARLYGLADSSVAQLKAEMSDGSTVVLPLFASKSADVPYRVFAYRVSRADLAAGVTPVTVVAHDTAGGEIARQETGVAG